MNRQQRCGGLLLGAVASLLVLLSRNRSHSSIAALEDAGMRPLWLRKRLDAERSKIRQERDERVDEFEKQLSAGWETLNTLKSRSASLMVDEGYYRHQAQHAKSEEEFYRARAENEDDAAEKAEMDAYSAHKAALVAEDEEQSAVAAKNVALARAAKLDERLQQQYMSAEQVARDHAKQMELNAARAYAVGLSPQGKNNLRKMHLTQWDGGSPDWAQSNAPEEPGDAWGATMRVAGDGEEIPRWLRHGLKPEAGASGHDLLGGRWTSWDKTPTFIPSRLLTDENR